MIEEIGTVVAVERDYVWVETQVKTTCSGCKASKGCPTSTIAKAFTSKANIVCMKVPCALVVGQQIKIGISEHALLKASLMVYIIPLLLLICSAGAFSVMLPNVHELIILIAASVSAFLGFWWASALSKHPKHKQQFAPVFLGATIGSVVTHKHEIPVHKIEQ